MLSSFARVGFALCLMGGAVRCSSGGGAHAPEAAQEASDASDASDAGAESQPSVVGVSEPGALARHCRDPVEPAGGPRLLPGPCVVRRCSIVGDDDHHSELVYAYDDSDRVVALVVRGAGFQELGQGLHSYAYDVDGNLLTLEYDSGQDGRIEHRWTYTYDERGRLLTEAFDGRDYNHDEPPDSVPERTWTHHYAADGARERKERTNSAGRVESVWSYTYDGSGNLVLAEKDGGPGCNAEEGCGAPDGSPDERVTYAYDASGRVVEMGETSRIAEPSRHRTVRYEYDERGNLASEESKRSSSPRTAFTSYAYDPHGNRVLEDLYISSSGTSRGRWVTSTPYDYACWP